MTFSIAVQRMFVNQIPNNLPSIDRFRVERLLGSGTYGSVYLGTYEGNKYAIKEVTLQQPMQTLWEISLYNLMSHPNIVVPFEYIPDKSYGKIAIVMPEAQRTLETAIYSQMKETDVKLLSWQLLSAMDYIHSNSIVHRDLKPTNVLLDEAKLTLIDFGLARFLEQDIDTMSLTVQTYTHRAPEVFLAIRDLASRRNFRQSSKRLGTPMDMWSVGLMILEMFLGYMYFYNSTKRYREDELSNYLLDAGNYMKFAQDIESLKVSAGAKEVLFSLLNMDPTKRSSASQVMNMSWFSNMRYQPAEVIRYPIRKVNMMSPTTKDIRASVDSLMRECRYSESVFNQMIKFVGEIYVNEPSLLVDKQQRIVYYQILLKIAAAEIAEFSSEYPGCGLEETDSSQDIYTLFKALRYNIIIR